MIKTRRFKALTGTKENLRIVEKIAVYDENGNQIDCCIIHKDNEGWEYYYPSNPHHKVGLFTDRPKDMIECIRNDFGDTIKKTQIFGIRIVNVIRFIDRKHGEELRQKTIEGWKNAKFLFGIKFTLLSSLNSMNPGRPICKDKTLLSFGQSQDDILTFKSEEEAESFIDSIIKKAKSYYEEYRDLELTGDKDYDYNNIFDPFFDKMISEIEGGADSIYYKVFSALDDEKDSNKTGYKLEVIQLVEHHEKGWTITYIPWESSDGKPKVAGRFKTTKEKNDFLETIRKDDSGWLQEEIATLGIHNDYNYMLPF